MKTYQEFLAESIVKGINKDEWTYGGNGFDSSTAPIERYLATKGSDFKAFAWEGLKNRSDLNIEVDGLKFSHITDYVAGNLDPAFVKADTALRREHLSLFSKQKGPAFVPKGGKWVIDNKLAKAVNFAGLEFAKNKTTWKGLDTFDFRKEFSGVMARGGFKVDMDTRKGVFKDPNVEYAFVVANKAR
ncbi:putative IPIII internal head protein [Salmonella phage STP4-a]|uniref:IPIII internal head protein n=1 Tax=Salmonella phage STP4-a TaxID=1445860 RepID=A0A0B4L9A4_9CAUD|nr:internal virion protein [Salmonella phage STP4-a]AHJ86969.1 putative IPIII internal head protein [Salmonella phage STP4-a]